MKRAVKNLIAVGLVPVLTCNALGGTHTIAAEKAGIVKLRLLEENGQCSGTVVGTRPLTVLTALHCLSDLQDGGILVVIKNEVEKTKASPDKYFSTKVVTSPALATTAEYVVMKHSQGQLTKIEADLVEADKALREAPTDKEAQARVTALRAQGTKVYGMYKKAFEKLKEKASMNPKLVDVAVVAFEKYDGELNQKNVESLIDDGSLIPVAPSNKLLGAKVSFGGYGMTGQQQISASKDIGAFTNIVRKQHGGLLATYGMVPGTSETGTVPRGEMGAVLPGDSGGPLMNDYGIVGVASWIKPRPMESADPLAPGWPQDRDGFYSYFTGRFVDIDSREAREVIESARVAHKLNVEENHAENLALTDLSSWNKARTLDILPPVSDVILAGAHP